MEVSSGHVSNFLLSKFNLSRVCWKHMSMEDPLSTRILLTSLLATSSETANASVWFGSMPSYSESVKVMMLGGPLEIVYTRVPSFGGDTCQPKTVFTTFLLMYWEVDAPCVCLGRYWLRLPILSCFSEKYLRAK